MGGLPFSGEKVRKVEGRTGRRGWGL